MSKKHTENIEIDLPEEDKQEVFDSVQVDITAELKDIKNEKDAEKAKRKLPVISYVGLIAGVFIVVVILIGLYNNLNPAPADINERVKPVTLESSESVEAIDTKDKIVVEETNNFSEENNNFKIHVGPGCSKVNILQR